MAQKYIPSIDGLRAIAISIVVSSHLAKDGVIPGGLGVTLFFFISGFLITGLLIDEQTKTGAIEVGGFYLRRFMRLAPALLTMVGIVSLTYLFVFGVTSASEIFAAVFYFMNFYEIAQGAMPIPLGPLWSLAIEEHFYLVFPLVISTLWKFREKLFFGLAAVCVIILFWRLVLVSSGAPAIRTYVGTDTRIDSILFGTLLAMGIKLKFRLDWLATKPALVGGLFLLLVSLLIRNPVFRETARYSMQGLAFVPLLYFLLVRESSIRTWLESGPATWLGKISYSLYLWHFPIMAFITSQSERANPIPAGMLTVAISFVLAAMSYYLVETPLRTVRVRHVAAAPANPPNI